MNNIENKKLIEWSNETSDSLDRTKDDFPNNVKKPKSYHLSIAIFMFIVVLVVSIMLLKPDSPEEYWQVTSIPVVSIFLWYIVAFIIRKIKRKSDNTFYSLIFIYTFVSILVLLSNISKYNEESEEVKNEIKSVLSNINVDEDWVILSNIDSANTNTEMWNKFKELVTNMINYWKNIDNYIISWENQYILDIENFADKTKLEKSINWIENMVWKLNNYKKNWLEDFKEIYKETYWDNSKLPLQFEKIFIDNVVLIDYRIELYNSYISMYKFLYNNNDELVIEDSEIYFENDSNIEEYNNIIDKLNRNYDRLNNSIQQKVDILKESIDNIEDY